MRSTFCESNEPSARPLAITLAAADNSTFALGSGLADDAAVSEAGLRPTLAGGSADLFSSGPIFILDSTVGA
jgi:hypothetical protein